MEFYNIVWIIGAISYLLSYFLLQLGKINTWYIYTILNLVWASCILYSLLREYNLPSVIIQVSWIFISVYWLYRVRKIETSKIYRFSKWVHKIFRFK